MRFVRSLFVLTLFVLLAACSAKYTGGGWILSDIDGGKANFGFMADTCGDDVKGQWNYHDKYTDPAVKMKGDILFTFEMDGMNCAKLYYVSNNPKFEKGEGGFAFVCMYDGGEGNFAEEPDWIAIEVDSGPFDFYSNEGIVNGNIQSHDCYGPDQNNKPKD